MSLKKAHFRRGDAAARGRWRKRSRKATPWIARYPDILYVPENAEFSVREGTVRWNRRRDAAGQLPLRADTTYVLPNGFRLRMEKQSGGSAWRLVGARPRGTLCHKPCTVSGGGKSEISKSIANVILEGPVFVGDFQHDVERVAEILKMDFSGIYKDRPLGPAHAAADSEPGADDGLGDSAFYAFARIHRRAQCVAAHAALRDSRAAVSP